MKLKPVKLREAFQEAQSPDPTALHQVSLQQRLVLESLVIQLEGLSFCGQVGRSGLLSPRALGRGGAWSTGLEAGLEHRPGGRQAGRGLCLVLE